MAQLDDGLQLQGKSEGALVPGRPGDDALLRVLAHMVVSDGVVHEGELGFLARVRPDLEGDALEQWAREAGSGELDVAAVAGEIHDPDHQWKCLRFTARMAWKDGDLADEERQLLDDLAAAMGMPGGAVDRVLAEMSPDDGTRYTKERILKCLTDIHWDSVQLASGDLVSNDLAANLPAGAEVVARIGLDRVEVMGLCLQGVVGRFQNGSAFLGWGDIVTYTRAFGLGASVTLHTEDGRSYPLVDHRLSGMGLFLDRLLGEDKRPEATNAPKIEQKRGD